MALRAAGGTTDGGGDPVLLPAILALDDAHRHHGTHVNAEDRPRQAASAGTPASRPARGPVDREPAGRADGARDLGAAVPLRTQTWRSSRTSPRRARSCGRRGGPSSRRALERAVRVTNHSNRHDRIGHSDGDGATTRRSPGTPRIPNRWAGRSDRSRHRSSRALLPRSCRQYRPHHDPRRPRSVRRR
jgi:hypothetical protein